MRTFIVEIDSPCFVLYMTRDVFEVEEDSDYRDSLSCDLMVYRVFYAPDLASAKSKVRKVVKMLRREGKTLLEVLQGKVKL